jgi:hypothetical protein
LAITNPRLAVGLMRATVLLVIINRDVGKLLKKNPSWPDFDKPSACGTWASLSNALHASRFMVFPNRILGSEIGDWTGGVSDSRQAPA